jgi:hypothetical protein
MYNNKKIGLTITSCKRIDLLRRCLKSFVIFCKEIDIIDEVLFFDDSSSDSDKLEMEELVKNLFEGKIIKFVHFYPDSFPKEYRQSHIMNRVREEIINSDIDFFFHLEDDYLFVNKFSIADSIDIMLEFPEYAYINYSHSFKNFPDHIKPRIIGDFWEWVYLKDLPLNEILFQDDVLAIQNLIPNIWIMYINWPYFSLRPGIHHVKKFLSIGEFSTNYGADTAAELEFAARWSKKYKSLCNKNLNVIDLGFDVDGSKSSFKLNESLR